MPVSNFGIHSIIPMLDMTQRSVKSPGIGRNTEPPRAHAVFGVGQANAVFRLRMEQPAEVLIGKRRRNGIPGWRDLIALVLVLTILILTGLGARQMLRRSPSKRPLPGRR